MFFYKVQSFIIFQISQTKFSSPGCIVCHAFHQSIFCLIPLTFSKIFLCSFGNFPINFEISFPKINLKYILVFDSFEIKIFYYLAFDRFSIFQAPFSIKLSVPFFTKSSAFKNPLFINFSRDSSLQLLLPLLNFEQEIEVVLSLFLKT